MKTLFVSDEHHLVIQMGSRHYVSLSVTNRHFSERRFNSACTFSQYTNSNCVSAMLINTFLFKKIMYFLLHRYQGVNSSKL